MPASIIIATCMQSLSINSHSQIKKIRKATSSKSMQARVFIFNHTSFSIYRLCVRFNSEKLLYIRSLEMRLLCVYAHFSDPSTNTVRTETYTDWSTRNGLVNHTVTLLVTPNAVVSTCHLPCSWLVWPISLYMQLSISNYVGHSGNVKCINDCRSKLGCTTTVLASLVLS